MLTQLAIASRMVVIVVLMHLTGLALLIRMLRSHHRLLLKMHVNPLALLICASLGIFAIHTSEIWLYSGLYLALGAATDFEQSLYFSTVTYTTIGYGDVLLPKPWRILGAIEGATGVIMLGWSTAFLISLLVQLRLLSHDWLSPTLREAEAKAMEEQPGARA